MTMGSDRFNSVHGTAVVGLRAERGATSKSGLGQSAMSQQARGHAGALAGVRTGARARGGFVHLSALVALCLGLVASTVLTVRLAASAGRHQLVYTTKVEAGMSSEEALGIAAGAFRGLIVNMLWIRANNLKQDGKFWEASDLARTITRLQPRFPRAWGFHAWNLAYNISVATQTPAERWQWVNAGIRLLRDEAIPRNPNSLLLHKDLSWIFLHKMQQRMDDANNYYKFQFAVEWTVAAGPPPVRTKENRASATFIEECAARFDNIAAAMGTPDELFEKFPQTKAAYAALKTGAGIDLDRESGRLEFLLGRERVRAAQRRAELLNAATGLDGVHPALIKMFTDESSFAPVAQPLLLHVRKRVLVETYKMEPDRMARYTRKYGPLDWRHPAAHALYWAARGVELALLRVEDQNRSDFDFINTDRQVIHSLQELYRTGMVQYDVLMADDRFFTQMPAADFIRAYDQTITELMEREDVQMDKTKGVDMRARVFRFYSAGYENFISDAIVLLYRRGQLDEAREYQLKLAAWAGRNQNDFRQEEIRTRPLEDYVSEQIIDRITTPNVALQEVYGSLQGAYFNGLLAGDDELFRSQFEYAKRFHKAYMDQQYRITNVDAQRGRMSGVMDSDFKFVAGQILFLTVQLVGPIEGSVMFTRAPGEVQPYAYLLLRDTFPQGPAAETEAGRAVARLFPKPPGFDAFERQFEAQIRQRQLMGNQEQK